MSLQIHAVMQEAKYIDMVFSVDAHYPEHDEVAAFASVAGNVERPHIAADFGALLDAKNVWAGG